MNETLDFARDKGVKMNDQNQNVTKDPTTNNTSLKKTVGILYALAILSLTIFVIFLYSVGGIEVFKFGYTIIMLLPVFLFIISLFGLAIYLQIKSNK